MLFFLVPAVILAAAVLVFLNARRTEPVYFCTEAFGGFTENLEGDPFTVYRWDGGETYVPVFTEEREELRPMETAISGHTLYYALQTGERENRIWRVDLKTGQKEVLADLDCIVREMETNGEELFLVVYEPEAAFPGYRLGVLREGAFLDCAPVHWPYSPVSCDASGCWYVEYDREDFVQRLCYLPSDTLIPEKVYEGVHMPSGLQAAPDGVYYAYIDYSEKSEPGRLSFYPRDGSGEVKLLTDLSPDGPEVSEKKRVSFIGFMALGGDKLFYVTYTDYYAPTGEDRDRGHYLHCLDRKTGKVTEYGRIDPDTGVGTVRFPCLLTWAKGGFLLNEADWWAQDPAEANAFSFYTWSGKRTELRQAPM